jgi:hypothetical protein
MLMRVKLFANIGLRSSVLHGRYQRRRPLRHEEFANSDALSSRASAENCIAFKPNLAWPAVITASVMPLLVDRFKEVCAAA